MNAALKGSVIVTMLAVALAAPVAGEAQIRRPGLDNGIDRNGDGAISRSEWRGNESSFRQRDWNNDGVLSGDEIDARLAESLADFRTIDQDGNGQVTAQEWRQAFSRMDRNNDGAITQDELEGGQRNVPLSQAYINGRDRGVHDGRQAGGEDKRRRNTWDLDGQRELDQADAGYNPSFGPREHYQAGYREGFRSGYAEGFGPR